MFDKLRRSAGRHKKQNHINQLRQKTAALLQPVGIAADVDVDVTSNSSLQALLVRLEAEDKALVRGPRVFVCLLPTPRAPPSSATSGAPGGQAGAARQGDAGLEP